MPGPPALVTTASPGPEGMGWVANIRARDNSSAVSRTSMTPLCRKAAWKAAADPAAKPMCAETARAPARVTPALSSSTGFFAAAWRAAVRKSSPFSTLSQ